MERYPPPPPPPESLYEPYKILVIYQFIKPSGNFFISSRFGGLGVGLIESGLIQKRGDGGISSR